MGPPSSALCITDGAPLWGAGMCDWRSLEQTLEKAFANVLLKLNCVGLGPAPGKEPFIPDGV